MPSFSFILDFILFHVCLNIIFLSSVGASADSDEAGLWAGEVVMFGLIFLNKFVSDRSFKVLNF